MGYKEFKRVENTVEIINLIISVSSDNSQDRSIKILLMIITGIMIIHKSYRFSLKKKYTSSARITKT